MGGEGSGKTVDVGEIEAGFEFGSGAREINIRWDQMDRQLGQLREKMLGESGTLVAPYRIVHLAPIDDAHEGDVRVLFQGSPQRSARGAKTALTARPKRVLLHNGASGENWKLETRRQKAEREDSEGLRAARPKRVQ